MRPSGVVAIVLLLAGCDGVFHLTHVGVPVDGSSNGGGDGPGSGTTGPRFVFVTKGTFVGDMTAGGATDALLGADGYCQGEANTAQPPLPGQYRAWLSTIGTAAAGRMTHLGGPFVLPDQGHTVVADSWGAFAFSASGGLPHRQPIDVTADGVQVASTGCDVWTNTSTDGTPAQSDITTDCYDWTTLDQGAGWPLGSVNEVDARFTANYACQHLACMASARLYCIQQ